MKAMALLTALLITASLSFGQNSSVGAPDNPGLGGQDIDPITPGLGGQDLWFTPFQVTQLRNLISSYRKSGSYTAFMGELSFLIVSFPQYEAISGILGTSENLPAALGKLTATLSIGDGRGQYIK